MKFDLIKDEEKDKFQSSKTGVKHYIITSGIKDYIDETIIREFVNEENLLMRSMELHLSKKMEHMEM